MKKPILLSAFVLALAMTGCTTKQPQFNVNDCASADWQNIGIKDGQNGYSAQRILSHQKSAKQLASAQTEPLGKKVVKSV